ncbi:hypothetical protein OIU76_003285 [Salix suchowensis]|uniref:Uncharacterized protein n=1 Tax=Salix koriyanagi TaxID=2511006 RepID=A0A9Q0PUL2_9ROSI|nr:hypothetical protein OIU78_013026 [Salix suchowensis]KAJ6346576.1 hypothetical protein OIU76_003285 [Salix suchowensis]KAJ6694591.1 hypothetical protein OIU74_013837 [Salix koriyanagi]
MNDEDGRRHLMMWIDKCKKTKRNPVEASTGKSRCKELNGPVVEEGSSKRDPEAVCYCSFGLGLAIAGLSLFAV